MNYAVSVSHRLYDLEDNPSAAGKSSKGKRIPDGNNMARS